MTSGSSQPVPRSLDQRREAALERLAASVQLWLATAGGPHGVHLIPVSYAWNGTTFTTATFIRSRTTVNIRADSHVRAAIGDTADVVMVDASASLIPVEEIDPESADAYAQVSHDPRTTPGFHYIRLVPQRIQVWKGVYEFAGRTVMAVSGLINPSTSLNRRYRRHWALRAEIRCANGSVRIVECATNTIDGVLPVDV